MKDIGNAARQETGRWNDNRSENSHLPFRRREQAMQRFRRMRNSQKFASVHSSVVNHFHQERHLYSRDNFKLILKRETVEQRRLRFQPRSRHRSILPPVRRIESATYAPIKCEFFNKIVQKRRPPLKRSPIRPISGALQFARFGSKAAVGSKHSTTLVSKGMESTEF